MRARNFFAHLVNKTLKYHDLILYDMVNTHLGIKDHTSGPN